MRAYRAGSGEVAVGEQVAQRPGDAASRHDPDGRQGLRPADRRAADARAPAQRRAGRMDVVAQLRLQHAAGLRAPADVPLRRGRLLRPVQRRRHGQLRRLPLELHQQPDRRRRPAHRARLHAHLHLQLSEPDVARAGPDAGCRNVDVRSARSRPSRPVRRLGLNLGAPGDRKADDGTLWLEYPSVGGASPAVEVSSRAERARVVPPAQLAGFRPRTGLGRCLGGEGTHVASASSWPTRKRLRANTRCGCTSWNRTRSSRASASSAYSVQGQPALVSLDVVKEAGGPNRSLVKELRGIEVTDEVID